MCGIFCAVYPKHDGSKLELPINIRQSLLNRGPDFFSELERDLEVFWLGYFAASVLWTQGKHLTQQPISNGSSTLLWNGDIYHGLETDELGDTHCVFEAFQGGVENTLSNVMGPYSFVYWDSRTLWFGRDPVGRHSLLCSLNHSHVILTSVSGQSDKNFAEVPAWGLFALDLSAENLELTLYPWSHVNLEVNPHLLNVPISVKKQIFHPVFSRPWTPLLSTPFQYEKLRGSDNPFQELVGDSVFKANVIKLRNLLEMSVKRRVQQPPYCMNCIVRRENCSHAKVSILFSGGLDSTILAVLAHFYVPENEPIDLINVAFEHSKMYEVPDRFTGFSSVEELRKLFPMREWNFIKIDVPKCELSEKRQEIISNLIHPLKSILDDSLGCAVWFGSRGEGSLNNLSYKSPARIILLGMGADELFGGYSRHRGAFAANGWEGLGTTLREEIRRIAMRNLGRDNRVVCDHGRQPRMPFLDEEVVKFADSLPPWERTCLTDDLPRGVGDKVLLRCLAWDLGLRKAPAFPKRAFQFGSRIANPREKGHNTSERLNK